MDPIRNILVPTDFSDGSRHAEEYAAGLATALGARITLVHVFHVPTPAYGEAVYASVVDSIPSVLRSCEAALQAEAAAMKDRGVQATSVLRQGDPAHEIADVARAEKADLVVIATHGRRGMARALLGSVAEKVVRTSGAPVMTMNPFRGTSDSTS